MYIFPFYSQNMGSFGLIGSLYITSNVPEREVNERAFSVQEDNK